MRYGLTGGRVRSEWHRKRPCRGRLKKSAQAFRGGFREDEKSPITRPESKGLAIWEIRGGKESFRLSNLAKGQNKRSEFRVLM